MKIGIALSGGGIRGIAHAGVLKALEENNIPIHIIGGTSSGSLVGSLYAMGYSPYYIYVLFKRYAEDICEFSNVPIVSGIGSFLSNKKITLDGLKSGENIEKAYNQIALRKGIRSLNDIQMPLVIPTVDIKEEREYIFTNRLPKDNKDHMRYITGISVGKAVRASSSFPAVFSPCKIKNHLFIDGGALDNIPIEEVRKQGADRVISVKFNGDRIEEDGNIIDIVMKVIDIMGNKIVEENVNSSDIVLNVCTEKTGLLDIDKLDSCYQAGYMTVMNNIEQIREKIFLK